MPHENNTLSKLSIHLLLVILVGLGGWNLVETNRMSRELVALQEQVSYGRKLREDFFSETNRRVCELERTYNGILARLAAIDSKLEIKVHQ